MAFACHVTTQFGLIGASHQMSVLATERRSWHKPRAVTKLFKPEVHRLCMTHAQYRNRLTTSMLVPIVSSQ